MIARFVLGAASLLVLFGLVACDDGNDVRTLEIAVGDVGCTTTRFDVDAGERLSLQFENESEVAFTIADEAERIDAVQVDAGNDASTFYTVPLDGEGTYVLHCESEGANKSEIELVVAAPPIVESATPSLESAQTAAPAETTPDAAVSVAISLSDFVIAPSAETVAPGAVNFIATNVSSESPHELNVLELQPDGSFINIAQIPPIAPQQGGAVRANLLPGTYRLACQIEIGEEGSTVDHYLQGMWFDMLVR